MKYVNFTVTTYRPSGAEMRKRNYDNLTTLMWSLEKQGAHVPHGQSNDD